MNKIETQDRLLKRYDMTLSVIEAEMTKLYGERYTEYRRRYALAGEFQYEPEFPLYLMLEQTYRCDLKCPSCIHGLLEYKRRFNTDYNVMPRNLFEQIILEGEQYNCPSIAFHSNDEPLLLKDLSDRVAFAKKHGFMDLFIATNGNLLNPRVMKSLIEAGITRILFSIDAATSETYEKVRPFGNFSLVMNNLNDLLEYKKSKRLILPAVRVSFVVNKFNIHELKLFIKTFSKLVDYVEIQGFSAYYNTNTYLIAQGMEHVKNFACNEPWRKLIIRANGDVLPCCSFYGYEVVLGNILRESLKDIFNAYQYHQLRHDFKKCIYRLSSCLACSKSLYRI